MIGLVGEEFGLGEQNRRRAENDYLPLQEDEDEDDDDLYCADMDVKQRCKSI